MSEPRDWDLRADELSSEAIARGGLHAVRLEEIDGPRWRATYRR